MNKTIAILKEGKVVRNPKTVRVDGLGFSREVVVDDSVEVELRIIVSQEQSQNLREVLKDCMQGGKMVQLMPINTATQIIPRQPIPARERNAEAGTW